MSDRELIVLGTSSQAPTRHRNHNGYLLRFDDQGILFDPGEGTQRQLLLAGVPATRIDRICITHLHGDHCLGLPGLLQRLTLDQVTIPVDLHFPASGQPYIDRLRRASAFDTDAPVVEHPSDPRPGEADVAEPGPPLRVEARRLEHRIDCVGWRISEPDRRHLVPERLAAVGLEGPAVGRLLADGHLRLHDGRVVTVDELSVPRRGQAVAFVMDTGVCDEAVALAEGVDLLVCEATYLDREADLAVERAHLTARQAATIAREAGARRLVLTHFSARYADLDGHLAEAAEIHDDVVVVRDLDRVPVPPRP